MADEESFDFWHEATRPVYRLAVPKRGARRQRIRASMWTVGGCVLSDFHSESSTKSRDAKLIETDGRRYLKLRRYLTGKTTVVTENEVHLLAGGATHLIDQSRPLAEISSDNHQINIFVPHAEIGYDSARHRRCLSFGDETPQGRIMADGVARLFPGVFRQAPRGADAAMDAFLGLVRLVLDGGYESEQESTIQAARLRVVRGYIEAHLADPALGVESLLSAGLASRATIYRDFADEGGVARYIWRRRLQMGLRRLANVPARWGVISQTAEAVGFNSIHAFSRAVRDEFGVMPSEVVGILRDVQTIFHPAEVSHAPKGIVARDVVQLFNQIRAV